MRGELIKYIFYGTKFDIKIEILAYNYYQAQNILKQTFDNYRDFSFYEKEYIHKENWQVGINAIV